MGLERAGLGVYISPMHRLFPLAFAILAMMPLPSGAHPHVFVDAKLRVQISDAGVFEGIEVAWTYDDFYSL